MSADQRFLALGGEAPAPSAPGGLYVPVVVSGGLAFVSGHGPRRPDGAFVVGKVGADLSVEEGRAAARLAALRTLAALRAELGSLDRVRRLVKVLGMVHAAPDFTAASAVVDGASELYLHVFGDRGPHARSAVGMAQLPAGMAVEVELVAQVDSV